MNQEIFNTLNNKKDDDFDKTIFDLIKNEFTFIEIELPNDIRFLMISYYLRNLGAHNIDINNIIFENKEDIFEFILFTIFNIIDECY